MWRVVFYFILFPYIQSCVEKTFKNVVIKVSLKTENYNQAIDGCVTPDVLTKYNKNELLQISVEKQDIYFLNKGAVSDFSDHFVVCFNKNNIHGIRQGAFMNLRGIEDINLSNNKIKNIETSTFFNFPSLHTISINRNEIVFIEKLAFRNLLNLNHVYLDHNKLTSFNQRWFKNTPNLSTLDLSFNLIKEIEESAFSSIYNLKVLSFYNNNIDYIDKYAFCALRTLVYLNLGNNRLKTINVDFSHLRNMRWLLLHLNYLTYVPSDVLQSIKSIRPQIKYVVLHTNPLQCSCYDEVLRWSSDNNIQLNYNTVCTDPVCVGSNADKCDQNPPDDMIEKINGTFYKQLKSTCSNYELVDNIVT